MRRILAEFAIQFLVLSQAAQHPGLADNVGDIALLQRAAIQRLWLATFK